MITSVDIPEPHDKLIISNDLNLEVSIECQYCDDWRFEKRKYNETVLHLMDNDPNFKPNKHQSLHINIKHCASCGRVL